MMALRLGLALLLGAAVPAFAADLSFEVANDSDLTIMEIYASPAGEGRWGEDLLRARVLPQGEVSALRVSDASSRCAFDLRFIFENGRELEQAADVCAGPSRVLRSAR